MRAKMEAAFGADLSGVELYESQTVADAGAQAMTMGNKIGFAPGKLDFASSEGQTLLGHELSHVVSQARGEVTGSGFLNDHALEARADREGAMAAAGESVYSGPVTPISTTSSALSAAGPMQAKKESAKEKRARKADATAERIIALSRGYASENSGLSEEEESEYMGYVNNADLGDDVWRALARKQADSQIAVSSTYNVDRATNQDLSHEEMLLKNGNSSHAYRSAAVGNFMGHINILSNEDRTGEVQRLAAMRREYLEGLDGESAAAAKQGADLIMESYGAEERLGSQDYFQNYIGRLHAREELSAQQALQKTAPKKKGRFSRR